MPEYLAPGVFVEETQLSGHPIEGISTSTAAFVGLTVKGPIGAVSGLITSYGDFERVYGGDGELTWDGHSFINYMAHAVRGFFENGGRRLYVVRVSPPQSQADRMEMPQINPFNRFLSRVLGPRFATKPAPTATYSDALKKLEDVNAVSVIAAPSAAQAFTDPAKAATHLRSVHAALMAHVEKMKHRLAVLDPPAHQSPAEVAAFANTVDSGHAALYYPWLVDASLAATTLPPSGAVCGIYARVDAQRGVWKAPANVAINGISGFERHIRTADQETLNPVGINVLREIPGRGMLVYGARTLSSDPEWRYVSVRRYISFLQKSILDGLDWVVFEPSDEPLWVACKNRIDAFLTENWRNGALQGQTSSDAFFVRCDRTTMTQTDIDNGRLIVQVGVATAKPAEFNIFQIEKKLR
ncbi:MAG: phage tail sheath subtilisin-like domain-containing protein [Roseobacter sp.]